MGQLAGVVGVDRDVQGGDRQRVELAGVLHGAHGRLVEILQQDDDLVARFGGARRWDASTLSWVTSER